MNTVTPDQAKETYERTVRDEPHDKWANWVLAIHNSLSAEEWIGPDTLPEWSKETYKLLAGSPVVSYADEKDKPCGKV